MHYSPFSAGVGLMAISRIPLGDSFFTLLARVLLDVAGAGFLLLGLFFVLANILGAIASRFGTSGGRHGGTRGALPRAGGRALGAAS